MFKKWHKTASEIDRKATKVRVDAHLQKSLSGKGIPLKTTQTFLTIFWESYSVIFKPICEKLIFPVSKILQVLCLLRYASYSAHPILSNYRILPTEARPDIPRLTINNKGNTDYDN